jgi:DNA-binding MarR family transcriptional regulator
MTAGELARESRLTTGAITAVIDRLEDAGLARRVRDPADRRRVRIVPTPDADRLSMELMVQPLTELSRPVMGRYDDDELRLLIDFHRTARDIQERHADWLRARLEQRER